MGGGIERSVDFIGEISARSPSFFLSRPLSARSARDNGKVGYTGVGEGEESEWEDRRRRKIDSRLMVICLSVES